MKDDMHTKTQDTAKLAACLKSSEYALIDAVVRTNVMTIREAGKLVAMQRKLRAMRYQVEAKARAL